MQGHKGNQTDIILSMLKLRTAVLSVFTLLLFTQCETPPPGSVVFDGDNDADAVVRDYLNINEEEFAGHKIIPIPTQHLRNSGDTSEVYVPNYDQAAKFD